MALGMVERSLVWIFPSALGPSLSAVRSALPVSISFPDISWSSLGKLEIGAHNAIDHALQYVQGILWI
jgi:hypothetical protein